jgi:hypothetical protein
MRLLWQAKGVDRPDRNDRAAIAAGRRRDYIDGVGFQPAMAINCGV